MGTRRAAATVRGRLRDLVPFGLDIAIFGACFLLYAFVRTLAPTRYGLAQENAQRVIDIERAMGIFWEPGWQQAALPHDWLIDVANAVYVYGHLPLIPVLGLALFLRDRLFYRRVRNALIISMPLAIPWIFLVPTAPPRLVPDIGVIDTLGYFVRSNQYAALPSFHGGWNAFAVWALWCAFPQWPVRGAAVGFGCLMWWSIVVTGNHFLLDLVLGVVVVAAAYGLSVAMERWLLRHPRWRRRLTFEVWGHRLPM
jgi:hypothetical protein